MGAISRISIREQSLRVLLPPILVLAALAAMLVIFAQPDDGAAERDEFLCPAAADQIAGTAAFLFDFRKPLDEERTSLPGELLRVASLELKGNTEIRIFGLTGSPASPRATLKHLCKPYDNADLRVESAKDQRGPVPDCDDLPAQLSGDLREAAGAFCAQRAELQRRLAGFAKQSGARDRGVANAYLVEALEDIRLDLSERPTPHRVYVFSDMMQHASWFSHLDRDWMSWNTERVRELVASRNRLFRQNRDTGEMQVAIYYVPRIGSTDQPRVREAHRQFWRDYFAGAQVDFHDQSAMASYSASPLTDVFAEADLPAPDRPAMEHLLQQIRMEREILAREHLSLAAERRKLEEERRLWTREKRTRQREEK